MIVGAIKAFDSDRQIVTAGGTKRTDGLVTRQSAGRYSKSTRQKTFQCSCNVLA
jgi:hypothetical protein